MKFILARHGQSIVEFETMKGGGRQASELGPQPSLCVRLLSLSVIVVWVRCPAAILVTWYYINDNHAHTRLAFLVFHLSSCWVRFFFINIISSLSCLLSSYSCCAWNSKTWLVKSSVQSGPLLCLHTHTKRHTHIYTTTTTQYVCARCVHTFWISRPKDAFSPPLCLSLGIIVVNLCSTEPPLLTNNETLNLLFSSDCITFNYTLHRADPKVYCKFIHVCVPVHLSLRQMTQSYETVNYKRVQVKRIIRLNLLPNK